MLIGNTIYSDRVTANFPTTGKIFSINRGFAGFKPNQLMYLMNVAYDKAYDADAKILTGRLDGIVRQLKKEMYFIRKGIDDESLAAKLSMRGFNCIAVGAKDGKPVQQIELLDVSRFIFAVLKSQIKQIKNHEQMFVDFSVVVLSANTKDGAVYTKSIDEASARGGIYGSEKH